MCFCMLYLGMFVIVLGFDLGFCVYFFAVVMYLFVSISVVTAADCLKRLVSKMTCYVSSRTLNPTY